MKKVYLDKESVEKRTKNLFQMITQIRNNKHWLTNYI